MSRRKRKLFVIDGMDGAGKKTQSTMAYDSLCKRGIPAVLASFPNYASLSGSVVKRYLNNDYNYSKTFVDNLAFVKQMSMLYAVDRVSSFMEVGKLTGKSLIELYNDGVVVICDRYSSSNLLHQTANLNIENEQELLGFMHFINTIEHHHLELPVPNKVMYLNITPEIAMKNLKGRYENDDSKHDLHENIEHLERVFKVKDLVARTNSWIQINCCRTDGRMIKPEEIAENILGNILTSLN